MNLKQLSAQQKQPDRAFHDPYAQMVAQMCDRISADRLLIYGGLPKSFLKNFNPRNPVRIEAFQPQIIGGEKPGHADITCSFDLGRVGPISIENSLNDLKKATLQAGFFKVDFPKGDEVDTGCVLDHPPVWWFTEFAKRFFVHTYQVTNDGFFVIVYPRADDGIVHS